MFFLSNRSLREARNFLYMARKALRYRKDLLSDKQVQKVRESIEQLQEAIRQKNQADAIGIMQSLEDFTLQMIPRKGRYSIWRENFEMVLVAIIFAASMRAYFLQPFKIPSGSMQPTLFGFVGHPSPYPPPSFPVRICEFFLYGRSYLNTIARSNEAILYMKEHQFLNFFTFTQLIGTQRSYWIFAPATTLYSYFGVKEGSFYRRGEVIVRGVVTAGDQLLVDKLRYHFIPPSRGDIFVFKTLNIPKIRHQKMPAEHYIKRLVGMQGDTLRINSPLLFINDKVATDGGLQQVMSGKNGFHGYANIPSSLYLATPCDTFTIPSDSYFALGDNSYNSSDSREWGIVPQDNVVGRAVFILWPFSARWGWIP